jgi:hypothetical protein
LHGSSVIGVDLIRSDDDHRSVLSKQITGILATPSLVGRSQEWQL